MITTQPAGQTSAAGGSYSFWVGVANGYQVSYQWYLNGTAIPGATTFQVEGYEDVTPQSAGTYTVVVTDGSGSTTSAPAVLTVNPVALPVIVEQPLSYQLEPGAQRDLQITTAYSPVTPTYQWYLNGTALPDGNDALYRIFNATSAAAGTYTVEVTNAAGTVTSIPATVTVGGSVAPTIYVQPASQTVNDGAALYLRVGVYGSGPLTYQWYLNGTALPESDVPGYTVYAASSGDAGNYTVTIANGAGSVTCATAVVTVLPSVAPAITTQPAGGSCPIDADETTLFVSATGSGAFTYQWYLNGVAVPNATSTSLAFAPYSDADAGTYTVTVTNAQGLSVTSDPAVEVTSSAPAAVPAFFQQPAGQTVVAGAPLSMVSHAFSSYADSSLTYQWMLNGTAIANGTQNVYSVPNASAADAGVYTCVCTSPGGDVTSAAANVVVLSTVAPTFLLQPVGAALNLSDEIELSAGASGTPSPTYQWYQGGVALPNATGPN
ncbi:MAG TPA: immunoglobulin domain-containing protein [Opitutaceae bacterium]